jgi:hypothetical protein
LRKARSKMVQEQRKRKRDDFRRRERPSPSRMGFEQVHFQKEQDKKEEARDDEVDVNMKRKVLCVYVPGTTLMCVILLFV